MFDVDTFSLPADINITESLTERSSLLGCHVHVLAGQPGRPYSHWSFVGVKVDSHEVALAQLAVTVSLDACSRVVSLATLQSLSSPFSSLMMTPGNMRSAPLAILGITPGEVVTVGNIYVDRSYTTVFSS